MINWKHWCCCLVWGMMVLSLQAAPIDGAKARQIASTFLASKGRTVAVEHLLAKATGVIESQEATHTYYIYNTANEQGFVVIAGDDRVAPVLGYTEQGHYDPHTMPDGLTALLQCYDQEIKSITNTPMTAPLEVAAEPDNDVVEVARHSVSPLLTTLWNQKDPYNAQCPIYNYSNGSSSGTRSATGCVATALAQVIAYHRYPSATQAKIPSYSFTSGGKTIVMPEIPAGTVIDWAHITNVYSATSTEEEINAVAQLMVMVGTGCEMVYGASSASNLVEGLPFLRDKLGYDAAITYRNRKDYTSEEWVRMLYAEVEAGRPVPYRGNSTSGAHAFVIDGYTSGDLFHVNWGWSGLYDGFFRLTALQSGDDSQAGASGGSSGYSMEQAALFGVQPNKGSAAADMPLTMRNVSVSGTSVTCTYTNFTGATGLYYLGIAYQAADGSLVKIASSVFPTSLQTGYETTKTFTVTGLPQGTWHVVPVVQKYGTSQWETSWNPQLDYVHATVSSTGAVTLSYPAPAPLFTLSAVRARGNVVAGKEVELRCSFSNQDQKEYHRTLYLFASTSADMGAAVSKADVTVLPKQEADFSFYFTPAAAGTYRVWIAQSPTGEGIVGEGQVEIRESNETSLSLSIVNCVFANAVSYTVYGNYRQATIYVRNNTNYDFDGDILVRLYRGDIGATRYGRVSEHRVPVQVKAGEVATSTLTLENMDVNVNYGFTFYYSDGSAALDNKTSVIYIRTQRPGIVRYETTGERKAEAPVASYDATGAAAIDLRGVSGVTTMQASANPNALYLLDEGATIPEGLTNQQVVVGGKITNLQLSANHPFVLPAAIQVENLTYQCVLPAVSTGGWQPLMLPFTPQSMLIDGVTARVNEEIYVREFVGTNSTAMPVFSPATQINAACPYVVKAATEWGGKQLTLAAHDVTITPAEVMVTSTSSFDMQGRVSSSMQEGVYTMNEQGTAFVYSPSAVEVPFFQGCFVPRLPAAQCPASIPVEQVSSAITTTAMHQRMQAATIYQLQGVAAGKVTGSSRSNTLQQLPNGVYVVGGRRVLVRH